MDGKPAVEGTTTGLAGGKSAAEGTTPLTLEGERASETEPPEIAGTAESVFVGVGARHVAYRWKTVSSQGNVRRLSNKCTPCLSSVIGVLSVAETEQIEINSLSRTDSCQFHVEIGSSVI